MPSMDKQISRGTNKELVNSNTFFYGSIHMKVSATKTSSLSIWTITMRWMKVAQDAKERYGLRCRTAFPTYPGFHNRTNSWRKKVLEAYITTCGYLICSSLSNTLMLDDERVVDPQTFPSDRPAATSLKKLSRNPGGRLYGISTSVVL